MVAARANWKGFIKFGEVACAVALYTAASSSERIAFNTLNRATGNRVRREFVDSETGDPVERDDQVKGYEIENGDYVVLEPDEVAAAIPDSDKTLKIEAFVPCNEIDDVYFDKPYYLAPDKMGADAFRLLRDGMREAKVAALARTVLFRRLRTVLIRPHGNGLIGTTLNFDYEVRSSTEAFDDIPDMKIEGEMLRTSQAHHQHKEGVVRREVFRRPLRRSHRRARQGEDRRPGLAEEEGATALEAERPIAGTAPERRDWHRLKSRSVLRQRPTVAKQPKRTATSKRAA